MAKIKPVANYSGEFSVIQSGDVIDTTVGGTGLSSFTAGSYLRAASTSTLELVTPSQLLSDINGLANNSATTTVGVGKVNTDIMLAVSNPGIGYANGFIFTRSSDGAGVAVTEYANDQTLYEMWMSDNPDTSYDIFSWRFKDYQGLNGTYQPLQISALKSRFIGNATQFYSPITQATSAFFTTGNPSADNNTQFINYINDTSKLKVVGTSPLAITALDVSEFTGGNGKVVWIRILSANSFEWGYGSFSNVAATDTGITIPSSSTTITLTNGIKVKFSSTTVGVAGEIFQFRAYYKPSADLSDTDISGTLDVSGTANFSGSLLADGSPVWTAALFDPTTKANVNNPIFTGTTTLSGDLLPDVDNVHSLGSPTRMWKDLYVGPGSLYLNGQKVLEDTQSGTIRITADAGQNISVQTGGTGDIELAPQGTGLIQLKGSVVFQTGTLIRSSDGGSLTFDDPITFSPGTGVVGGLTIDGYKVWHAGNDGVSSGLDADMLDGQQGSYYLAWANLSGKPTTISGYGITDAPTKTGSGASGTWGIAITGNAATATKLATARTINGVSFDGSVNITLPNPTWASISSKPTTLSGYGITDAVAAALIGTANGIAPLGSDSKIPATYLPSFVDDVIEFVSFSAFPATGEASKLYVATDDDTLWRWTGSIYVNITSTSGNADTATKWSTARSLTLTGKASGSVLLDGSADASLNVTSLSVTKYDVGLGNVDNTSDINKPVSSAVQTALDGKVNTKTSLQTGDTYDALLTSGFYRDGNITGSGVPGATFGQLLVVSGGGDTASQMYFEYQGSNIFVRSGNTVNHPTGAWSAWRKLWHDGNFDPTTKLDVTTYTAADVLSKIKSVDGSGSGVDADLLDGQHGSYYLSAANLTGTLSAARSWALTGDVTSAAGSNVTSISNGSITLAKMASVASGSLLGRSTAGVGVPEAITIGNGLSLTNGVLSVSGGGGFPPFALSNGTHLATWSGGAYLGTGPNGGTVYAGTSSTTASLFMAVDTSGVTQLDVQTDGTLELAAGVIQSPCPKGALVIQSTSTTGKGIILRPIFNSTVGQMKVDYQGNTTINGQLTVGGTSYPSLGASYYSMVVGDRALGDGFAAILFNPSATQDGMVMGYNAGGKFRIWDFGTTGGPVRMEMDRTSGDTGFTGALNAARIYAGYDAGMANSVSCSNWFRSSGSTGWYNATYTGGWYMTDDTYVRSYNNKAVLSSDFVISSDERLKAGIRPLEYKGRLNPVNYTLIETGKAEIGFIAQDILGKYPEVVGIIPETGMLQLSYPKLTAVLSYQINLVEDRVIAIDKTLVHVGADYALMKEKLKSAERETRRLKRELYTLQEKVNAIIAKLNV